MKQAQHNNTNIQMHVAIRELLPDHSIPLERSGIGRRLEIVPLQNWEEMQQIRACTIYETGSGINARGQVFVERTVVMTAKTTEAFILGIS